MGGLHATCFEAGQSLGERARTEEVDPTPTNQHSHGPVPLTHGSLIAGGRRRPLVREGRAMRVVLFCGGLGLRMRDGVNDVPKPMTMVGHRPLIWHVMRYYAHFGHTEFVLCLGYGAHHIKNYFLNYQETASNDFVLSHGGARIDLLSSDIAEWTIHFIDTGVDSAIGERLRRVRHLVGDDEMFLANYSDVLTDAPLPLIIDRFRESTATVSLLAARPDQSFHCVDIREDGSIRDI